MTAGAKNTLQVAGLVLGFILAGSGVVYGYGSLVQRTAGLESELRRKADAARFEDFKADVGKKLDRIDDKLDLLLGGSRGGAWQK